MSKDFEKKLTPLEVLQLENKNLRLKLENLETMISEITPELEGLSLETRILKIKSKNLQFAKDNLKFGVLIRHIRKLLVSTSSPDQDSKNVEKVKRLLDQELYIK